MPRVEPHFGAARPSACFSCRCCHCRCCCCCCCSSPPPHAGVRRHALLHLALAKWMSLLQFGGPRRSQGLDAALGLVGLLVPSWAGCSDAGAWLEPKRQNRPFGFFSYYPSHPGWPVSTSGGLHERRVGCRTEGGLESNIDSVAPCRLSVNFRTRLDRRPTLIVERDRSRNRVGTQFYDIVNGIHSMAGRLRSGAGWPSVATLLLPSIHPMSWAGCAGRLSREPTAVRRHGDLQYFPPSLPSYQGRATANVTNTLLALLYAPTTAAAWGACLPCVLPAFGCGNTTGPKAAAPLGRARRPMYLPCTPCCVHSLPA